MTPVGPLKRKRGLGGEELENLSQRSIEMTEHINVKGTSGIRPGKGSGHKDGGP